MLFNFSLNFLFLVIKFLYSYLTFGILFIVYPHERTQKKLLEKFSNSFLGNYNIFSLHKSQYKHLCQYNPKKHGKRIYRRVRHGGLVVSGGLSGVSQCGRIGSAARH